MFGGLTPGAAIPDAGQVDTKLKILTREKDGYFFLTNSSTHWDNITFQVSAHIHHSFKYVKSK